ncbi:unnamed protein product [Chondrus crispus]|uniref:Tail specific protease domain-containing protein n=1 Tax=Chondrus crispus TaxID=2769 RepID=R7Q2H1_CHOCR|nr:unnamed protein product [Chondrus crispus]CDF32787.1 unnamed protein product [Chondrus crispus]|eukprot:XP_005712588.1 unnamed protein product [Chondrus crispus]
MVARCATFPILVTLLLFRVAHSIRCQHSKHCTTDDPKLLGLCAPRHRVCFTIPHPARHITDDDDHDDEDAPLFVSLSELIEEANADKLSVAAKRDVIDAVKTIYMDVNPHRFLHENLLKIDFPAALDSIDITEEMTNVEFHENMMNAFQLMDDYHSVFLAPEPLRTSVATLGFAVAKFFEEGSRQRQYIVNDLLAELIPSNSSFGIGSELLLIDGVPIDKYVLTLGKNSSASNLAAQIDSGIFLVSFRTLAFDPIPFSSTVDIVYLTTEGIRKSITLPWFFTKLYTQEAADTMSHAVHPAAYQPLHGRPNRVVFSEADKRKLYEEVTAEPLDITTRVIENGRVPIEVSSEFTERFTAEVILTKSGPIGRFVIPDFGASVSLELALEIARILRLMPLNGLIMDLRSNAGGDGDYVKLLAESLVSETVPPNPNTLRVSQFLQDLLLSADTKNVTAEELILLPAVIRALNTSLAIGEQFTGPTVDIYSSEFRERFAPRAYFGPVLTLVDGICYSAGDLYTSLQKDYGFSRVVGVSDNVGAGGASVYRYSQLAELFPQKIKKVESEFTMAYVRFFRSGTSKGAIIENFGIKPDVRYYPTRNDAFSDDCDLYEFLGSMLKDMREEKDGTKIEREEFDATSEEEPMPEEGLTLEEGPTPEE